MTQRYFGFLKQKRQAGKMKLASTICSSSGLVLGVFTLSMVNQYDWTDIHIWGLGLLSISLLIAFAVLETRPKWAFIGIEVLSSRWFSTSLAAQLVHFAGLSGVLVLMPFYLERVKGLEPLQVSFYLLILPIMMFLVAPLSGFLSDRIGFRLLTSGGLAILAIGLYLLTGLTPDTSGSQIATFLVVTGFGVGLFTTPNQSALMGSIGQDRRAKASGILATNRNIGMSVGVALATSLFARLQQVNEGLGDEATIFVSSMVPVIWVAFAFVLIGIIFCLLRGDRHQSASSG